MEKATDALLKDHRLIRKVLQEFTLDNPRFPDLLKTLHRTVAAHAWFEDIIFLPALQNEPRLRQLEREISEEHQDIEGLLKVLRQTDMADHRELDFHLVQLRSILDTHFRKEEDALFPLSERVLSREGLLALGEEMHRRRAEVRGLVQE